MGHQHSLNVIEYIQLGQLRTQMAKLDRRMDFLEELLNQEIRKRKNMSDFIDTFIANFNAFQAEVTEDIQLLFDKITALVTEIQNDTPDPRLVALNEAMLAGTQALDAKVNAFIAPPAPVDPPVDPAPVDPAPVDPPVDPSPVDPAPVDPADPSAPVS